MQRALGLVERPGSHLGIVSSRTGVTGRCLVTALGAQERVAPRGRPPGAAAAARGWRRAPPRCPPPRPQSAGRPPAAAAVRAGRARLLCRADCQRAGSEPGAGLDGVLARSKAGCHMHSCVSTLVSPARERAQPEVTQCPSTPGAAADCQGPRGPGARTSSSWSARGMVSSASSALRRAARSSPPAPAATSSSS